MTPLVESKECFDAQMEGAWRAIQGDGVALQTSSDFPNRVNERLATVEAVANMRSANVDRSTLMHVERLLAQARNAGTKSKGITWLRKAADTFSQAVSPHAACQKGCTHCCHIPLNLTETEATFIGKTLGVKPATGAPDRPVRQVENVACPFLSKGVCSIYENRPVICRSHFNMDADALLCELVPGAAVPVPYMDNRSILLNMLMVAGVNSRMADIRDWFPDGLGNGATGVS